jgi:hypothetical protein
MLRIDWLTKLRYFLQTVAFCLAVAAIEYMFQPQIPYECEMVYSLGIGLSIWASVDLGRHAFPSAAETGWPQGLWAWLLPLVGIGNGFVLGTLLGDAILGADSFGSRAFEQMMTSVTVTLMAGGVASFYFYSKTRGLYLERRVLESHHLAAEARLKLLETQLEPHMLFNTLANLRALIGVDPARAQTMLDHMIAYLRATLSASRADPNRPHTLQDEFARLQDYLELMAIRMGPRLQYTLDLPEALLQQPVPPLLLQPLVENSIQHGLEPKVEGGSIRVRASRQGELLCLEVQDSGLGLPAPTAGTAQGHQGFGLQQVRERLHTAYGALGTIKIGAAGAEGTRASITFPLQP